MGFTRSYIRGPVSDLFTKLYSVFDVEQAAPESIKATIPMY
jgi:hypothetical protein